jgi:hypothetical protein
VAESKSDAKQFGKQVIVLLIGGAWPARAPFKIIEADHS